MIRPFPSNTAVIDAVPPDVGAFDVVANLPFESVC
jgi:hypothetical protein